MSAQCLSPASNVLVTGATGLIGGEIVRKLRAVGVGKVWALVRPRPDEDAAARFAARLQRSGADAADLRVDALPGDITLPNWGLSADDLIDVTRSVDVIIHCAADTSFLCRDSVPETNIQGARHLIELASRCRRRPLIVYMSTATNSGKASHACLSEEQGCRPENAHHNEYTRSKAVAETLLRHCGLPVLTLRPTIVLSAGLPDAEFARQILWFIPLAKLFDCLPVDPTARLDVVPVSFVVDATVALLQKADRAHDCYHLSAGARYATVAGPGAAFLDQFYRRRRSLRLVAPADWTSEDLRAHVRTPVQRRVFFGLRYYLPFLNMDVVYDNGRLRDELGEEAVHMPPLESYLGPLLRLITAEKAMVELALP